MPLQCPTPNLIHRWPWHWPRELSSSVILCAFASALSDFRWTAEIAYPFELCNRSTARAVDSVHTITRNSPHTRGALHQSCSATWSPSQLATRSTTNRHALLRFSPSVFIESTRGTYQFKTYYFLVLFSSVLAPVLLSNSARRPTSVRY